ncbi:hypothetical protein MYCSP_19295 [Mycobacteroides saopaulense]|nr:hypothetical protein MYCSP_19295 [Mycobacteroides saopaulense]
MRFVGLPGVQIETAGVAVVGIGDRRKLGRIIHDAKVFGDIGLVKPLRDGANGLIPAISDTNIAGTQ